MGQKHKNEREKTDWGVLLRTERAVFETTDEHEPGGLYGLRVFAAVRIDFGIERKRREKMRSWKNKIAAVILLVAVSGGVTYYASFLSYKNTVDNIEITDMTAEGVSDGTYEGESDAGFVRARVKVTVKEEKIVDIVLVEHKNGRGKRAEKVVDEVLTEQTTNVETVSGATNSSLVILQAIERALEKGADSGTEA